MPRVWIRRDLLERDRPRIELRLDWHVGARLQSGVAVAGTDGEGGFEGGEALLDGRRHRIRKPRLNPLQALLESDSLGGDGGFQGGKTGVDGAGAVGEGAVTVVETAVELVEAGVERVEDVLQGWLHGAASAI